MYDFLTDSVTKPEEYDLIVTGDLGYTCTKLLYQLMEEHNIRLDGFYKRAPDSIMLGAFLFVWYEKY